jgi:hypothetical protein
MKSQNQPANQLQGGGTARLGAVDPAAAAAEAERKALAAQALRPETAARKDEVLVRVAVLHPKKKDKVLQSTIFVENVLDTPL